MHRSDRIARRLTSAMAGVMLGVMLGGVVASSAPASAAALESGRYRISDYQGALFATVTGTSGRVTMAAAGAGFQYWALDVDTRSTNIVNVTTGKCMAAGTAIPGTEPAIVSQDCFANLPIHWQVLHWTDSHVLIHKSDDVRYCMEVRPIGTPPTYELYLTACRYGSPTQLFQLLP